MLLCCSPQCMQSWPMPASIVSSSLIDVHQWQHKLGRTNCFDECDQFTRSIPHYSWKMPPCSANNLCTVRHSRGGALFIHTIDIFGQEVVLLGSLLELLEIVYSGSRATYQRALAVHIISKLRGKLGVCVINLFILPHTDLTGSLRQLVCVCLILYSISRYIQPKRLWQRWAFDMTVFPCPRPA